jgi:hypothetical protein
MGKSRAAGRAAGTLDIPALGLGAAFGMGRRDSAAAAVLYLPV